MSKWNKPLDGGCRCGQVRIRISAPPTLTMACHCTGCQRMSSSAYSLSVVIGHDKFEVISGEPVLGGLHGPILHYFCPRCMSWMFTKPEEAYPFVNLRPTMLDEPGWFPPFIEIWAREKLPWVETPAIHKFDTLPKSEEWAQLSQYYIAQAGW